MQPTLRWSTRNEGGVPTSCVIKYFYSLFPLQPHIFITGKDAQAKHHIQNHGSLLSTNQAPNNWFLYPITLNKKALQKRIPSHTPGNM